jgi:3-oxoacyl-[acyl-carrier protein] reductase
MTHERPGKLEGKVALITGASRGIGAQIARRFSEEGASVVLGYRVSQEAVDGVAAFCRDRGVGVSVVQGDLAEAETAARWSDLAIERHGRVDVLVNAAGVASEELLATLEDEHLERVVATNVLGVTRMCRAILKPMLRQRSGVILNVSSVAATRPGRGQSVYAGTKGFLEALTRALAVEVGRKGIRVNALAPGVVETTMTSRVLASAREDIVARIPLRRIGDVGDISGAAVFLVSDDAAYVTGAVLAVDGGFVGGM